MYSSMSKRTGCTALPFHSTLGKPQVFLLRNTNKQHTPDATTSHRWPCCCAADAPVRLTGSKSKLSVLRVISLTCLPQPCNSQVNCLVTAPQGRSERQHWSNKLSLSVRESFCAWLKIPCLWPKILIACIWHKTFLVQLYWHLAINLYCLYCITTQKYPACDPKYKQHVYNTTQKYPACDPKYQKPAYNTT